MSEQSARAVIEKGASEAETRRTFAGVKARRQKSLTELIHLNHATEIANKRLKESKEIGVSEARLRQEG